MHNQCHIRIIQLRVESVKDPRGSLLLDCSAKVVLGVDARAAIYLDP